MIVKFLLKTILCMFDPAIALKLLIYIYISLYKVQLK